MYRNPTYHEIEVDAMNIVNLSEQTQKETARALYGRSKHAPHEKQFYFMQENKDNGRLQKVINTNPSKIRID